MKGHVYIIQMLGTNFYKIGMTRQKNPYDRIKSAETYAPLGIKEIKIIESVYPSKLEKELHNDFKHKRKKGEWFELNNNDLKLIDDKYSVSQGKLLKTLEKLITICGSEELLYSLLKSNIDLRNRKQNSSNYSDIDIGINNIIKDKFTNIDFTSSDVLKELIKTDNKFKNLNVRRVGIYLSRLYLKKRKWKNSTSRTYYNTNHKC